MEEASQVMDPMAEQNDNSVMTPEASAPDEVESNEPQPTDDVDLRDDQSTVAGDDDVGREVEEVSVEEDPEAVDDAPVDAPVDATLDDVTDDSLDDAVEIHPRCVVEAILFAADSPMPPAKIAKVLGVGDARDVRKHIDRLNEEYEEQGRAFRIEQIAAGFQMLTIPAFNTWLSKLLKARQETKLTPASMETLAIVAYKQPCTRADIEAVRGVAAGDIVNRLREMNLVKIVGRAEDLGRPLLYGTTRRFLEVFGLPSLEDLPQVEALSVGAKAKPKKDEAEVEPVEMPQASQDDSLAEDATAIVGEPATDAANATEDTPEGAESSPHLVVRDDDEDASDDMTPDESENDAETEESTSETAEDAADEENA